MSGLYNRCGVGLLVVHHLGNGRNPITTKEELLAAANPPHPGYPNGYDYPEYEWGILADGSVINMRPCTVVGAHTTSDIPQYMKGKNWWNQNSMSVVVACDCELFAPTDAQRKSLVEFIRKWMKEHRGTFDDVYPHSQITRTSCPGKMLFWESVEQEVRGVNVVEVAKEDLDKNLIVWVRESKVEDAIKAINALGFAVKVLPLELSK